MSTLAERRRFAVENRPCTDPAAPFCRRPMGKRCRDENGKERVPHLGRLLLADGFTEGVESKQAEVEALTAELDRLVTALEHAEAAREDALQDAAGYARLLDAEKAAHAETRTVAVQVVLDLRATIGQRDRLIVQMQAKIDDLEHPTPETAPILFGAGGGNVDRTKNGIDIDRWYGDDAEVDKAITRAKLNHAAGVRTWMSFKLPYTWAEMAAGKGDTWATGLFAKLDALGFVVWVAFHHEPEGDGSTTDWRKMQDRLSRMVPGGIAGDVKFWLIVTGWTQEFNPTDTANQWSTLYPTGAPIYGIAYDAPYLKYGFEWANGVKTTKMDTGWTEGSVYIEKLVARAKSLGVHAAIGECGFSDEAFVKDKAWLDRMLASAKASGLLAVCYFDTPLNSKRSWFLGAVGSLKRAHFNAALSKARGQ